MAKLKPLISSKAGTAAPAHMTWASRTISSTVTRTRQFLGRRIWVWPIIAVGLLLAIGWGVHGAIEQTMEENLRSELETLRDVEVQVLRTWLSAQEQNAMSVACDVEVRRLTRELFQPEVANDLTKAAELSHAIHQSLLPVMNAHKYEDFFIADRDKVIASSRIEGIGLTPRPEFADARERVFAGAPTVTRPYKSVLTHRDEDGSLRSGVPMMFVVAPIVDEQLQVIALLALQIRPEEEFTRVLQLGRTGESGETYAFDASGLMLSNSRFDHDLVLDGLLQEGTPSILNLLVRDPGGDVTAGYRPDVVRSELPLTRMAMSATAGNTDSDVTGYRDYRGVPVVGAWTWFEKYGFGVTTELDFDEAFRPLTILKRAFWGLLFLLAASSVAIFVVTLMMARLQKQARESAIEARQLGQYKLEEKLGEGAMGVVYRGRHAMLRRPTAIKLLDADKVNETSIERFEREVQITSHLNHANTIAIYDYGHTPEDVFYYAMEFLDGIDLQQLVDQYGPQPPERVIYILKQVCGSLYEAHSAGLVHRDIKPANIMINRRGGEGDVVKVLDFGLVKARSGELGESKSESMAGTPLYMSPEAIQLPNSVDACSDLYAVGAIGYFLLTGKPVFDASSLADLLQMHVSDVPEPPSQRLGKPIPAELEHAILSCLEKTRAKRPQTSRELAKLLDTVPLSDRWTLDRADAWWSSHERQRSPSIAASTTTAGQDATVLFE